MHEIFKFILLICLVMSVSTSSFAQSLEGKIKELTLDNGMRWFFIERHTAPTFSGVTMFKVGGVDEEIGKTGLSHLFEHMAFKGTSIIGSSDYESEKKIMNQIQKVADALTEEMYSELADTSKMKRLSVKLDSLQQEQKKYMKKNEFKEIYNRHGANGLNAGTSKDVTTYFNSLPANRLELWCLIESQRIYDPVFRGFYKERDVVIEERRMRIENSPWGKLYEQFLAAAYTAHPYNWPTVGWMSDISQVSVKDARKLYETYYAPSNGVGVLVGDFDTDEAMILVEKYFSAIPAGETPPEVTTKEPPQKGERRVEVEYDAEPRLMIGYHIPTYPNKDDIVLEVISKLLTRGRSSRLNKTLVKEKRMATNVNSWETPGDRYANMFEIVSTPIAPHTTADLEEVIYQELDKLKTEPVSERELQKVKNWAEMEKIWRIQSNMWLSYGIAKATLVYGDWRYYENYRNKLDKITPEDIMNVAKKYFDESNRTVAILKKSEGTE